jgi:beta-glucanase (GH16 family)
MAATSLLFLVLLVNIFHSCFSDDVGLSLALEDNFNTFNLSLWKHEITLSGGGNWEFQAYLNNRSNSFVRDGKLYIKPTLMEDQIGIANVQNGYTLNVWGGSPADYCTQNQFHGCERASLRYQDGNVLNPIKSARLRTAESFFFRYGKVEVRAKLPRGDWLWPAIWMLPRYQQYGIWPSSGEIDIMESRGNPANYTPGGYDSFGSTLHWGIDYLNNFFQQTHAIRKTGIDLTSEFHNYGLVWNETYIGTYFDDESNVVLSVPIDRPFWEKTGLGNPPWDNPWEGYGDNAPFDQEFYLILNVACGGVTGFFPDGYGKPWSNGDSQAINTFYDAKDDWFPTWENDDDDSAMQIDYVKVWTYSSDHTTNAGASNVLGVYLLLLCVLISITALGQFI